MKNILRLLLNFMIMNSSGFENILGKSVSDAPSSLQIAESRKTISSRETPRGSKGEGSRTVKKSILKTRDGSFEEKPLYILWNRKDFQIEILIKHDQGLSKIFFRRPTKTL